MMVPNPLDFIKAFEGVDVLGGPKSVVVLQNQTYTRNMNDEAATPNVHDEASTLYAILKFAIHNGLLSVTLLFEDFEDEDYLRFKAVCTDMTLDAWDTGIARDSLEHHLVLTITDKIDHNYFMTCFVSTYAFDGLRPSATFACRLDDAIMYQLPDDVKNQMLDEQEEYADNNSDLEFI